MAMKSPLRLRRSSNMEPINLWIASANGAGEGFQQSARQLVASEIEHVLSRRTARAPEEAHPPLARALFAASLHIAE
jgi:hypothetical protein